MEHQAYTTEEEYLIYIKTQRQLDHERIFLIKELVDKLEGDSHLLMAPAGRELARIIVIGELIEKLKVSGENEWHRLFKGENDIKETIVLKGLKAAQTQNPYSAVNIAKDENKK